MACYLRAWGTTFDVDAFLALSPIPWNPVWRKGQKKQIVLKAEHDDAGVTTLVTDVGETLEAMALGAIAFLVANEAEVQRLSSYPGVERVCLDFGVPWYEDMAAQYSRLSPELLSLAARHGCWVEISHYLTAREPAVSKE
jgi:hypothetical protein